MKCLRDFPRDYPKVSIKFTTIEEWPSSAKFQLVDCPGVYEADCYDHSPMVQKVCPCLKLHTNKNYA